MNTPAESVTRSFNRTSMESKRGNVIISCIKGCRVFRLLIEPVWNRNELQMGLRSGGYEQFAFNRTSMESKLVNIGMGWTYRCLTHF